MDAYRPEYSLGRLTDGGRMWEPIPPYSMPRWAEQHRVQPDFPIID
jgi:hypothetical protein